MRVGVTPGQHVLIPRQWIEKVMIEQIVKRRRLEFVPASELISREEVLRHDVRLVIRWIFLTNSIAAVIRQQRACPVKHPRQKSARLVNMSQRVSVDEAGEMFVQRIANPQIRLRANDGLVITA